MKRLALFLALALGFSSALYAQNATFKEASEAYRAGKFEKAAGLFEELAVKHPRSAEVYYNLGNSYFRAGREGMAILAYERARLFKPRHADVLANLAHARGLLQYRVQDKRSWYLKAAEEVLNYFTEREILLSVLFFYFLFAAAWAWEIFRKKNFYWGPARRILAVLVVLFAAVLTAKNVQVRVLKDAIITAKEGQVRYGPSDSDQLAFRLGEGLKIYVLDRREEWSRVLLVNGETGWVRNDQIAGVRI